MPITQEDRAVIEKAIASMSDVELVAFGRLFYESNNKKISNADFAVMKALGNHVWSDVPFSDIDKGLRLPVFKSAMHFVKGFVGCFTAIASDKPAPATEEAKEEKKPEPEAEQKSDEASA